MTPTIHDLLPAALLDAAAGKVTQIKIGVSSGDQIVQVRIVVLPEDFPEIESEPTEVPVGLRAD